MKKAPVPSITAVVTSGDQHGLGHEVDTRSMKMNFNQARIAYLVRPLLFVTLFVFVMSTYLFAQSNPTDGPWSGSIQCQLDIQQQGYVRHETQTWTLTSSMPVSKSGDIQIYSANWTATGQGGIQRNMGMRASIAQWNINVPPTSASIAMFIRAQDKQFVIRVWQRPIPATNTLRGTRQLTENGIVQPGTINNNAKEWPLPWILAEARPKIEGKFQAPAESLGAELSPTGSSVPPAECAWQFSRPNLSNVAGSGAGGAGAGAAAGGTSISATGSATAGGAAGVNSGSGGTTNSGVAAGASAAGSAGSAAERGGGAASGARAGAATNSSTAGNNSGAAASAKYGTDSQGGAAGAGALGTNSGTTGTDASVTTNQTGGAASPQAEGSSAAAGGAGRNSQQPPGASNTPIPNDTTGSVGSSSQTCTLSDVATMYDKASQNIELMFDKLAKEAKTARKNLSEELPKESLSASVASRDEQRIEQVKYLDQTIAQFPSLEQGALQELAKEKQQSIEQITKAQNDTERNGICQTTLTAINQLTTTAESEANAFEEGIAGVGGSSSGLTPTSEIGNSKNSSSANQSQISPSVPAINTANVSSGRPAKQPQTPSTPASATATLAPQVVKFQARGQDFAVGNNPTGIAFDGTNIWVVNKGDRTVTKLRASDGTKLGSFPTGFNPIGIAFDGSNIWVVNIGDKTVSKIRASDGANLGNFLPCAPTEQPGGSIAFDGIYIWVSCPTTLSRLRPSDGVNMGMFTGGGGTLQAFDGTYLLATGYHSQRVMKRQASDASLSYLDSITYHPQFDNPNAPDYWDNDALPYNSQAEGITFDGANIWITVHTVNNKNFVCKRRASDGVWLGEFPVGEQPVGAGFDGTNIWVANSLDNTITKLRASDGANLGTYATGNWPTQITFDGTHIWVINSNSNTVSRF